MVSITGCRLFGDRLMTFEDIACSSLILERFGKIASLGLNLLEESHIADGDHGLVGKGLEQGDLLVGERVYLAHGE